MLSLSSFISQPRRLRFSAEGDVVVEIEVIKPCFYIFAGLAQIADALVKNSSVSTSPSDRVRLAGAPLLDLPGVRLLGAFLNPGQHFAIALSGRELGLQRFGGDPGKTKPVMVHRVVVFVLARGVGDFGAPFIVNAAEDDVPPRRTRGLREDVA